jgi:hypothetical protein
LTEIRRTDKDLGYVWTVLKDKKNVVTRAGLLSIPHHKTGREDINLKLGRYNKPRLDGLRVTFETPESDDPKSELTLDHDEVTALVDFVKQHYEPMRAGASKFIPVSIDLDDDDIENLRALFSGADTRELVRLIIERGVVPETLLAAVEYERRCAAVQELETMLEQDLSEHVWQAWFEKNDWILGTDFVQVVDDRRIDVGHIADYLMKSYDGFLDIVEIKKPNVGTFWAARPDHGNLVPSADLTKAVAQANRYIFQVERQMDSKDFCRRVGYVPVVKPRSTLIFGRSQGWEDDECEAYRIFNSAFHSLTVLTYDHVLLKGRRMLGIAPTDANAADDGEEIPF